MAAQPATFGNGNRPIVVVRRKRHHKTAHHGGAWKVAYADFVTAMMAFFMLLWLISNQNRETLQGLADYFSPGPPMVGSAGNAAGGLQIGAGGFNRARSADRSEATGIPAMDAQSRGTARGGTATIPDASLRVMAQEMRLALQSAVTQGASEPLIERDPDGIRITLMDSVRQPMFAPNNATLTPYANHLLSTIGDKLVKSGMRITIEGHSDSAGGDVEANWRLSSERALASRAILMSRGLTADRIAGVIARAASQPLYPDAPMRAENRRIVIIIRGETPTTPADASFRM